MKEINSYPQSLLDLIADKDFEILTANEKEIVHRHMEESEYEDLRRTWLAVSLTEKPAVFSPMPSAGTTDAIFQRFRNKQAPSPIVAMFQSRIPVWQAAAILLLAIGTTLAFIPRKELVVYQTTPTDTDTVYVEKAVEKTAYIWDTVYIARASDRSPAKPEKSTEVSQNEETDQEMETAKAPPMSGLSILRMDQAQQLPSGGKSLGDDSIARNFKYVTL